MPYKTKKDRRKYDRAYNKFRTKKLKDVRKALEDGNTSRAKHILDRQPKISITKKKKRGRRRSKK